MTETVVLLLDFILAFVLLVAIPARALWRSWTTRSNQASNTTRYRTTIGLVSGLLALLALDWLLAKRPTEALGLGVPANKPALVGLTITIMLLTTFGVILRLGSSATSVDAQHLRRELRPENPEEIRLFLLLALAVGFGWEVLYRGFLLFYLPSQIGLAAAVVASAVAYGAAHGFDGPKQFVGSIVAAFAFTLGYVLTQNLWWLMLLHAGLPLIGLLAARSDVRNGDEHG